MFARRVFELMSSNTLVISNYSKGVEDMFGDLVVFPDREPERLRSLSETEINELREQALTLVLREHTYSKRWFSILKTIGIKYNTIKENITISVFIRGREDALNAIAWFQQYRSHLSDARLLLIVDNSVSGTDTAILYQEFNRLGIGVTSVRHATRYALDGYYQPIETAYFILADVKALPTDGWIEKAQLHLQYMYQYAIVPALNHNHRYRIAPSRIDQLPVMARASHFVEWLQSKNRPILSYYV
jgi:hypothetical protein